MGGMEVLYTWFSCGGHAHLIDVTDGTPMDYEQTLCQRAAFYGSGKVGAAALEVADRKCRICEQIEPWLRDGFSLEYTRRKLWPTT